MLIGGDDISNDVITLARYFSTFAYIRAHLRFALIGGNLTAQSMGSHRGIGGGIQIPETELQALLPFPALLCFFRSWFNVEICFFFACE